MTINIPNKTIKPILTAQDLGILVREARKAQGLTQDDLAGITKVGRRFISDLENGKKTIQLDKAIHVLSSLGVALVSSQKWKKENQ